MKSYGEMLRAARLAGGWSLRVAARAAGVSHPAIADLEYGRRKPSDDMHNRLMVGLRIEDRAEFDVALAALRAEVDRRRNGVQ